jgi:FkbM family methyltransferase
MRLLEIDGFRMLTRLHDRFAPINVLDIGASVGHTVWRTLEEFPAARIWALEPEPESFAKLAERTRDCPNVQRFQLAAGPSEGTLPFHVNAMRVTSGLLAPSATGREFYKDWVRTERTIDVPVVRVDRWAPHVGLDRIDVLKLDVQGLELDVLKSCEGLITGGCWAIDCEAPFVQEYERSSTFLDVALYLRNLGFELHQVHNLWACGREQQSTCMDGLWLRRDKLAQLRSMSDEQLDVSPAGVLRRVLRKCEQVGLRRVGLMGCGNDLRLAHAAIENAPVEIACLIDDSPALAGTHLYGRRVLDQLQAIGMGLDAVVITTSGGEAKILASDGPLNRAKVPMIPIAHHHPTHAHPLIAPEHRHPAHAGARAQVVAF